MLGRAPSLEEQLVSTQLRELQGTPRYLPNDFQRLRILGQGKYGTSHLVRRLADGALLCNKQVAVERFSTANPAEALHEIELLVLLDDHPHVIQYVGSFVSDGKLHILMEFADEGSLQQHLDRRRERQDAMEEPEALDICVQILSALQHLHSKKVLHRDLKPGNIFFDRRRLVRLGDFGIAKLMGDGLAQTVIGTPLYLPPEVIQGRTYDYGADIWALGTLLYEMVALRHPFAADNLAALALAITAARRAAPTPAPAVPGARRAPPAPRPALLRLPPALLRARGAS